MSVEN